MVATRKKVVVHICTIVPNFTNTPNPYAAFKLLSNPILPIESKNGLPKSDNLRRTPETGPSNPRGSIEPSLRTTALAKLNSTATSDS